MRAAACLVLSAGILIAPRSASSQGVGTSPPTPTPPVLSTVLQPPRGIQPEPAQMSGAPLQVGDLPPGIVAVRVIRRTFQDNVKEAAVMLRVSGGQVLSATTGADGRAQFQNLRIGAIVQARALVDGETLESQQFDMPAQGGVRLVLVAGVGARTATGPAWDGNVDAAAAQPKMSAPYRNWPAATDVLLGGLIVLMLVIIGFVWQRRRPGDNPATDRPSVATLTSPQPVLGHQSPHLRHDRRASVFEALVQLEKDHESGRITSDHHATRREALIEELIRLDEER